MATRKATQSNQQVVSTKAISADPSKTRNQLSRIRGQIDGVIKMYDEERECVEIVRQIMAVRSSLGRVSRDLLTNEAVCCSRTNDSEEMEKILKEVFR